MPGGIPVYYATKIDGIVGILAGVLLIVFAILNEPSFGAISVLLAITGLAIFLAGAYVTRTRPWKTPPGQPDPWTGERIK